MGLKGKDDSEKSKHCEICLFDFQKCKIFKIDGCPHYYCFSCIRRHVKKKLLDGIIPICPHENCESELNLEECDVFFPEKLSVILTQRLLKEAIVPVDKRVYCPYSKCLLLTSTSEVWVENEEERIMRCVHCHKAFCINCYVPKGDIRTRRNHDPFLKEPKLHVICSCTRELMEADNDENDHEVKDAENEYKDIEKLIIEYDLSDDDGEEEVDGNGLR
ncbi:E3 ubiquitin-protein ligase RSL1-like [Impatiens glandulifera]|uniref:E3 ubiquitin-protein ligase RSL1-like n=1 Tax=Impatiens glandulifera TaxID=253017 RepID=UPI001FB0A6B3|nr:E3 ubiquitin-protein ligase RSL1-like [Impatiens glandulifera]